MNNEILVGAGFDAISTIVAMFCLASVCRKGLELERHRTKMMEEDVAFYKAEFERLQIKYQDFQ